MLMKAEGPQGTAATASGPPSHCEQHTTYETETPPVWPTAHYCTTLCTETPEELCCPHRQRPHPRQGDVCSCQMRKAHEGAPRSCTGLATIFFKPGTQDRGDRRQLSFYLEL